MCVSTPAKVGAHLPCLDVLLHNLIFLNLAVLVLPPDKQFVLNKVYIAMVTIYVLVGSVHLQLLHLLEVLRYPFPF